MQDSGQEMLPEDKLRALSARFALAVAELQRCGCVSGTVRASGRKLVRTAFPPDLA
jgi:hypothetical protein